MSVAEEEGEEGEEEEGEVVEEEEYEEEEEKIIGVWLTTGGLLLCRLLTCGIAFFLGPAIPHSDDQGHTLAHTHTHTQLIPLQTVPFQ